MQEIPSDGNAASAIEIRQETHANTHIPCTGNACGTTQITWDAQGCIHVSNTSARPVKVDLGTTASIQMQPHAATIVASPFGGCIKSYVGQTRANYTG